MAVHDAHCHFFSRRFFEALARAKSDRPAGDPATELPALLGWESPGTAVELADRWVSELDKHGVARAALIASVPGDEESVAEAVSRHPRRFVGFFMVDPTREDALERTRRAFSELNLKCACLFPAMHHYHLHDERAGHIFDVAASNAGAAVFVHCGVLSVGVRKKLGLPSPFDMRLGNPLDLHLPAATHPGLPILIPHFGAGFFREALMVADQCPNVYFDTSSSNSWTKYQPSLTLRDVFRRTLDVVGPDRLLFGTDSSFFPRGWQATIWELQRQIVGELEVEPIAIEKIFSQNFDRLFPAFTGSL